MTTEQKAQAIEAKIREVCPELQELSFGCEVEVRIGTFITRYGRSPNIRRFKIFCVHESGYIGTSNYAKGMEISKDDITKIIGHPIHLEHVLRANDKNWNHVKEQYDLTLSFSDNMKDEKLVGFLYSIICEV